MNNMMDDRQTTKKTVIWPFVIQLCIIIFVPIVILWSNTQTNILNSSDAGLFLESLGAIGATIIFFGGIPAGIIGIRYAKRHPENLGSLTVPTKALSIFNIIAGSAECLLMLVVFIAAMVTMASGNV